MLPQELIEVNFDSSQGSATAVSSIYLMELHQAGLVCEVTRAYKYHKNWRCMARMSIQAIYAAY